MTAKTKRAIIDALTTAGVLPGLAAPELGSLVFGSDVKGREPSLLFRYWRFVTTLERGKVPMVCP
jgi:hypothetical protein